MARVIGTGLSALDERRDLPAHLDELAALGCETVELPLYTMDIVVGGRVREAALKPVTRRLRRTAVPLHRARAARDQLLRRGLPASPPLRRAQGVDGGFRRARRDPLCHPRRHDAGEAGSRHRGRLPAAARVARPRRRAGGCARALCLRRESLPRPRRPHLHADAVAACRRARRDRPSARGGDARLRPRPPPGRPYRRRPDRRGRGARALREAPPHPRQFRPGRRYLDLLASARSSPSATATSTCRSAGATSPGRR